MSIDVITALLREVHSREGIFHLAKDLCIRLRHHSQMSVDDTRFLYDLAAGLIRDLPRNSGLLVVKLYDRTFGDSVFVVCEVRLRDITPGEDSMHTILWKLFPPGSFSVGQYTQAYRYVNPHTTVHEDDIERALQLLTRDSSYRLEQLRNGMYKKLPDQEGGWRRTRRERSRSPNGSGSPNRARSRVRGPRKEYSRDRSRARSRTGRSRSRSRNRYPRVQVEPVSPHQPRGASPIVVVETTPSKGPTENGRTGAHRNPHNPVVSDTPNNVNTPAESQIDRSDPTDAQRAANRQFIEALVDDFALKYGVLCVRDTDLLTLIQSAGSNLPWKQESGEPFLTWFRKVVGAEEDPPFESLELDAGKSLVRIKTGSKPMTRTAAHQAFTSESTTLFDKVKQYARASDEVMRKCFQVLFFPGTYKFEEIDDMCSLIFDLDMSKFYSNAAEGKRYLEAIDPRLEVLNDTTVVIYKTPATKAGPVNVTIPVALPPGVPDRPAPEPVIAPVAPPPSVDILPSQDLVKERHRSQLRAFFQIYSDPFNISTGRWGALSSF
ncbi:hypothetical protein M427DRAFT_54219 [Gonapodya prolifera JEL478]|uniref:Uncharacterized protein n=1 Tax=Gonapodya prolifera (strain JEL478) TaxID=1344416 RepID=A0A139AMJ9_GONPJ|nr:hypothetical protein M427DRAFT_54219 [Gonapodya prolifera JEL478]|eukprot:KXS18001.1 hypothetical protein M427DRAFT_54219 [Gonapodya prolifera JEL478]